MNQTEKAGGPGKEHEKGGPPIEWWRKAEAIANRFTPREQVADGTWIDLEPLPKPIYDFEDPGHKLEKGVLIGWAPKDSENPEALICVEFYADRPGKASVELTRLGNSHLKVEGPEGRWEPPRQPREGAPNTSYWSFEVERED